MEPFRPLLYILIGSYNSLVQATHLLAPRRFTYVHLCIVIAYPSSGTDTTLSPAYTEFSFSGKASHLPSVPKIGWDPVVSIGELRVYPWIP